MMLSQFSPCVSLYINDLYICRILLPFGHMLLSVQINLLQHLNIITPYHHWMQRIFVTLPCRVTHDNMVYHVASSPQFAFFVFFIDSPLPFPVFQKLLTHSKLCFCCSITILHCIFYYLQSVMHRIRFYSSHGCGMFIMN